MNRLSCLVKPAKDIPALVFLFGFVLVCLSGRLKKCFGGSYSLADGLQKFFGRAVVRQAGFQNLFDGFRLGGIWHGFWRRLQSLPARIFLRAWRIIAR